MHHAIYRQIVLVKCRGVYICEYYKPALIQAPAIIYALPEKENLRYHGGATKYLHMFR